MEVVVELAPNLGLRIGIFLLTNSGIVADDFSFFPLDFKDMFK